VILFDSIHHVVAAEKVLKERGVWIDLVPVPRVLSADCGMAIAFHPADLDLVLSHLCEAPLRWGEIHRPEGDGYGKVPTR